MEENPSTRYPSATQDVTFNNRKMKIEVDTIVFCDICKLPMFIKKVIADRSLTPYQYPYPYPVPVNLSPSSLDILIEMECEKCGTQKEAIAQNIDITEKKIIIKNLTLGKEAR